MHLSNLVLLVCFYAYSCKNNPASVAAPPEINADTVGAVNNVPVGAKPAAAPGKAGGMSGENSNSGLSASESYWAGIDTITIVLEANDFEVILKERPTMPLIDVRPAAAYQEGHLARAVNIEADDPEFKKKIRLYDQKAPIALYGDFSDGAKRASKTMQTAGFRQIYMLRGGVRGWVVAHKILVRM